MLINISVGSSNTIFIDWFLLFCIQKCKFQHGFKHQVNFLKNLFIYFQLESHMKDKPIWYRVLNLISKRLARFCKFSCSSALSLTLYNCYCISIIWSIKEILNEEYRMKKAKSQCIFHVILISRSIFYSFLCFWGYYTAVVSCRITYIDVFSSSRGRDVKC